MSAVVDSNTGREALTARVPDRLKQQFYKACAKRGVSVRKRMLDLVQQTVDSEVLPQAETPSGKLSVLFVRSVDKELKARFKSFCVLHDVSLERAVASLIQHDLASGH
jgi:antitoxin component of RelBE/YafQ-DinJ toxin-antitoxin module